MNAEVKVILSAFRTRWIFDSKDAVIECFSVHRHSPVYPKGNEYDSKRKYEPMTTENGQILLLVE